MLCIKEGTLCFLSVIKNIISVHQGGSLKCFGHLQILKFVQPVKGAFSNGFKLVVFQRPVLEEQGETGQLYLDICYCALKAGHADSQADKGPKCIENACRKGLEVVVGQIPVRQRKKSVCEESQ